MFDSAKEEPNLHDVLNDPIIRLLMLRDGVEPDDLLPKLLQQMAANANEPADKLPA